MHDCVYYATIQQSPEVSLGTHKDPRDSQAKAICNRTETNFKPTLFNFNGGFK